MKRTSRVSNIIVSIDIYYYIKKRLVAINYDIDKIWLQT